MFFLLLLLAPCSCGTDHATGYSADNALVFEDSIGLTETSSVSFELDSVTGFYHRSIQYVEIGDSAYFTLLNEEERTLYFYDYFSGAIIKKIKYSLEGPNGLHSFYRMGHHLIAADSILVYNPFTFQLALTNGQGEIINKYKVREKEQTLKLAYPDVNSLKPVIVKDNKAYLTGLMLGVEPVGDHREVYCVSEIDFKSGAVNNLLPRPHRYNGGQWGMVTKYHVFPTYNPYSERFVFSFGAMHDLIETDFDGIENRHYNGSKYFEDIPAFSHRRSPVVNKKAMQKYDLTTPSFFCIFYDRYRRLYYRFSALGLNDDEYNAAYRKRKFSVIILNEDFEKVGETVLPEHGYHYSMVFINKNGLHIANENEYNKNEKNLTFGVFTPVLSEKK